MEIVFDKATGAFIYNSTLMGKKRLVDEDEARNLLHGYFKAVYGLRRSNADKIAEKQAVEHIRNLKGET